MTIAATIKKRYGKYSVGPFNKETVVIELVSDGDNQNFVNFLMASPEYVTVRPCNYDATSDTASVTLSGRQATVHDGTVGRTYIVEAMGF
jgi:hypothetical protein